MTSSGFAQRLVVAGLLAVAACAKPGSPAPKDAELVVLLPDPEDGKVGKATVSASGTTVQLDASGEATHVTKTGAPATPAVLGKRDLDRLMADAKASRPLAPETFLLYFESGKNTLTAESVALVPKIIDAIKARPAPDLTVIGHTDRTADVGSNFELGMSRAVQVRDMLAARGVDPKIVSVASHGESDPLVPTSDGVAHPRNRRVAVTVR